MNFTFKYVLYILFFLSTSFIKGQELIGEIKMDSNYKNITNLSGALNDSISFHLIINKIRSKKGYHSSIHFFNQIEEVKKIDLGETSYKPEYLSFHVLNDVLTLFMNLEDQIIVKDIDFLSGELKSKKLRAKPIALFSHRNITFFVLSKSFGELSLAFIRSSENIKLNRYDLESEAGKKLMSEISGSKTEFMDNTRHIKKGSIIKSKAFYDGNDLIIIQDDKKKSMVLVLRLKENGESKINTVPVRTANKLKKLNSFATNNRLFSFAMIKNNAVLKIYDLETIKKLKSFSYNNIDFGKYNKVVINGENKTNSTFKIGKFFNSYFPQKVGSIYNAELYTGVNITEEDGYIVQIGHVDKNTYKNESSGNYWWNYGAFVYYEFGSGQVSIDPNAIGMMIFNALAEEKRKGNYFELYLDSNLEQIKNRPVPKFISKEELQTQRNSDQEVALEKHFFIAQKGFRRLVTWSKSDQSYKIYNLYD